MNSEDEYQVFGKYVAHKLRGLKGNQQIFARKLINDIIFEGELESLTKDFKVMNCASVSTPQNYYNSSGNTQPFGAYGFQQSYHPQPTPSQPINVVNESNHINSDSQSQSVISNYLSSFNPINN